MCDYFTVLSIIECSLKFISQESFQHLLELGFLDDMFNTIPNTLYNQIITKIIDELVNFNGKEVNSYLQTIPNALDVIH